MVLSMDRWSGKVAVVTGASSGIGAAIAAFLVAKGLLVVGLARRSDRIKEAAKKLSSQNGQLFALKTNVCNEEDVVEAFNWIDHNVGPVHILINNAAVLKESSLTEGETETWRSILETNVLGLCVATREAVRRMKNGQIDGHIIHINSITGHKVYNELNFHLYGPSKWAVTALTDILRQELGAWSNNIRVTSLSPGFVTTEMTALDPENSKERQEFYEKIKFLKSEDVAEAVGYILATPQSVQINELTITPTGGIS